MRRSRRSPHLPSELQSWARALAEGWPQARDVEAVCRALAISSNELSRRLRKLRGAGHARRVTLFDPVRAGRTLECMVLIRLGDYTAAAMSTLEAALQEDRHVLSADAISGVFDYQIYCAFPDVRTADRWLRALRESHRPAGVEFRHVRTRWGSSAGGVVLAARRELKSAALEPCRPSRRRPTVAS